MLAGLVQSVEAALDGLFFGAFTLGAPALDALVSNVLTLPVELVFGSLDELLLSLGDDETLLSLLVSAVVDVLGFFLSP